MAIKVAPDAFDFPESSDPANPPAGYMRVYANAGAMMQRDSAGTETPLGSGASLPVVDTTAIVKGSADATKLFRIEVDGFTTATTRVATPPDEDFTMVGVATSQTLANKILSQLQLLIGGFKAILTHSNSADRTYTLPNVDLTFIGGSVAAGTVGTTDNRLTRSDGTSGNKIQGSGVTLDDNGGLQEVNQLNFLDATELTLDTNGEITVTGSYHRLDTFSNAASDTLVTINGGEEGDILYVRTESAARQVIIQNYNGIGGNIYTHHGQNLMFSSPHQIGLLLCVGASWKMLGTLSYYDIDSLASETSPADDDLFFLGDTSGVTLKKVTFSDLATSIKPSYAILRHEETNNTSAGATTTNTWTACTLNTESYDPSSIVSLSSNKFTPIAGTYKLTAFKSTRVSGNNRLRLYNVTDATAVKGGTNGTNQATGAITSISPLMWIFTADGTDEYRFDVWVSSGNALGLGLAINTGETEVYLESMLEKIA
jgi:hypothetical protein